MESLDRVQSADQAENKPTGGCSLDTAGVCDRAFGAILMPGFERSSSSSPREWLEGLPPVPLPIHRHNRRQIRVSVRIGRREFGGDEFFGIGDRDGVGAGPDAE